MPVASLDPDGTVFYYDDSGDVPGSTDYTTVILIHGGLFHCEIFRPLFSFAAPNNLRLVALNLRDYPGSTPLSAPDLEELCSPEREVQRVAVRKAGLEIARFVEWFVKKEEIPPRTKDEGDGSARGGLSVLGWSAGNMWLLSFLGNANSLPPESMELLGRYLRSTVLYDPVYVTVGAPNPHILDSPVLKEDLPLDERIKAFSFYVASWYTPLESLANSAEKSASDHPVLPALRARRNLSAENETGAVMRPATVSLMEAETLANMISPDGAANLPFYFQVDPTIHQDNLERALFLNTLGKGEDASVLPNMKVHLAWCNMTTPNCLWGSQYIQDFYQASIQAGRPARELSITKLNGANHFLHWEEPERFVNMLAQMA